MAFSLVALRLARDPGEGAAIVVAMTLAQVLGAIPLARLDRILPPVGLLRALIGVRTTALLVLAALAAHGAALPWFIAFAAVAGSVNGAAFGILRSLLNAVTPARKLPRALGIAATLNEVTFVLGPVVAAGLGAISPALAVLAAAILGAAPAFMAPDVRASHVPEGSRASGSVLTPSIALRLAYAAASGATVASVEIGAVALAMRFALEPALAVVFTVPLCLCSIAGGVWASLRNRPASRRTAALQLCVMAIGAGLTAAATSVAWAIVGVGLVGAVLAPLGVHYSLTLDALAPRHRRAEVFALLRTANAVGVILAGTALTMLSPSASLSAVTGLMVLVALVAGADACFDPSGRRASGRTAMGGE